MTTNTINGITYFDAPDTDGCEGCVARSNSPLCAQLQQTGGGYNYCADHNVIWILPDKPKAEHITAASKVLQQAPVEVKTSQGTFTQATAAGLCEGCVAEKDKSLCREIIQITGCKDFTKVWVPAKESAKPVPGIAEAIQLIARESSISEVLEYCKVHKISFRI